MNQTFDFPIKTKKLATYIALSAAIIFASNFFDLQSMRDTEGYLDIADNILAKFSEPQNHKLDFSIRMPLLPLIFALAKISFLGFEQTVLLIHAFAAMLAIGLFVKAVDKIISRQLSVFILSCYFSLKKDLFLSASTEWLAVCFLIIQLALLIKIFQHRKIFDLFSLSLISSFALLLRPSMISAYSFTIIGTFLLYQSNRSRFLQLACAMFFGNIFLLLWAGLNLHNSGSFTLFPFSGISSFGLMSVLGKADVETGDSEKLKTFINEVNRKKHTVYGGYNKEDYFFVDQLKKFHHHNVWRVGFKLSRSLKLSLKEQNLYMRIYSQRVLLKEKVRYFFYFWHSMGYYLHSFFAASLILFAFFYSRKKSKPLFCAILSALIFHYTHSALCSALEMPNQRYLAISYDLPILCSVIFLFRNRKNASACLA